LGKYIFNCRWTK